MTMSKDEERKLSKAIINGIEQFFGVDIYQTVKFYQEIDGRGYGMICHLLDLAERILKEIRKENDKTKR